MQDKLLHSATCHGCACYRYLLRVTVSRSYGTSVVKEFPFWIRNTEDVPPPPPGPQPPIKVQTSHLGVCTINVIFHAYFVPAQIDQRFPTPVPAFCMIPMLQHVHKSCVCRQDAEIGKVAQTSCEVSSHL